jgi:hypothetical protein
VTFSGNSKAVGSEFCHTGGSLTSEIFTVIVDEAL